MRKRATKIIPPDGKTFTSGKTSLQQAVQRDGSKITRRLREQEKAIAANPDVKAAKKAMTELDQAIANPKYRFEERVADRMKKGSSRTEAEQLVRKVIEEKELPGDRPHIHVTAKGEAHFVCGEISFAVDTHDLNKAIGTNGESNPLHRLMDSQIASMARVIGLGIDPFVRELIEVPLQGLLQLVWYRDIDQHESDHLNSNQAKRVAEYHRHLAEWKPADVPAGERKPRTASSTSKSSMLSKNYILVPGEHKNIAKGRESDLLAAIKKLKMPASFSDIANAAKDRVKTKQDFDSIIARFLRELIEHGALKGDQ